VVKKGEKKNKKTKKNNLKKETALNKTKRKIWLKLRKDKLKNYISMQITSP